MLLAMDETNAEKCMEKLQDIMFQETKESEPFIFPHVNTTPHKSIFTKIYLSIHKISALPYPVQSPNVHIIENVLLRIKNQMNPDARDPSRSKQQLVERVFEE